MMAPDTIAHNDVFPITGSNTSNVFDEVQVELQKYTTYESLECLVVDDVENINVTVFKGHNTLFGIYGYSNMQTLRSNESVANGISDSDIFLEHRRSMSCQPLWRDMVADQADVDVANQSSPMIEITQKEDHTKIWLSHNVSAQKVFENHTMVWLSRIASAQTDWLSRMASAQSNRARVALSRWIAAPFGILISQCQYRKDGFDAGRTKSQKTAVVGMRVGFGGQRVPFRAAGMIAGDYTSFHSAFDAIDQKKIQRGFYNVYDLVEEFDTICKWTNHMFGSMIHSNVEYNGHWNVTIDYRCQHKKVQLSIPYGTCMEDMIEDNCCYMITATNQIVKPSIPLIRYGSEFVMMGRLRGGTAKTAPKAAPKTKTGTSSKNPVIDKPLTKKKTVTFADDTNPGDTKPTWPDERGGDPDEPGKEPEVPGRLLGHMSTGKVGDKPIRVVADKDWIEANTLPPVPDSDDDVADIDLTIPKTFQGKMIAKRLETLNGCSKSELSAFISDLQNLSQDVIEADSEFLNSIVLPKPRASASTKPVGECPKSQRNFSSDEYETYRTQISLWGKQNSHVAPGDQALLILNSLDESTKQYMLVSLKAMFAGESKFEFATFLKMLDLKHKRNKIQNDLKFEEEYRQLTQPGTQNTAEFTQTLRNAHQKLIIAGFDPESRFALKVVSKYKSISNDKRVDLTNMIMDLSTEVDEKGKRKFSEWQVTEKILDALEKHGLSQEAAKAAAPQKPPKISKVNMATDGNLKNQPKDGNLKFQPNSSKGAKGAKGKGKGGKGGKFGKGGASKFIAKFGKGKGKGQGGSFGNPQYLKGAKKDFTRPPARPPAKWQQGSDWICRLCRAFNFTKSKEGQMATSCWFCKRTKDILPKEQANQATVTEEVKDDNAAP